MPLKIKLKNQFREPLNTDAGFVGREDELARLITIFQQRQAATVLVAGHRGVGKSALVDEALKRSQADKKKRVVARLTLPHLSPGSSDIRDQILQSLARSLYFSIKDDNSVPKPLREVSKVLYDKTYLKELHEQTGVESLFETEAKARSATKTKTSIAFGKIVSLIVGTSLSGVVAIGGIAVISRIVTDHGLSWGIVASAVVLVTVVLSAYQLNLEKEDENTTIDKATASNKINRIGLYDVSPETLEFELRDLIKELAAKGHPCVFVIDELDKLEAFPKGVQQDPESAGQDFKKHIIFRILSSLKNFFTLGSGIFVFISGEDFYAQLNGPIETDIYSLAHTLFTDQVFVQVLYYQDVERLIEQIIAETPADEEEYHRFRNYLCWRSRNHVFDLLSLIGEFVRFDNRGQPFLWGEKSGAQDGHWHEGNLPTNWEVAAALQKIVGAAYDESARPSAGEQRFNQALWLTQLRTAYDLFADMPVKVPEAGFELPAAYAWVKNLTPNDLDDLAGAVERLLAKLERYGAVRVVSETLTPETEGQPDVSVTSYTLVENPPYPPTSVNSEVQRIPLEDYYLDIGAKAEHLAKNLSVLGIETPQLSDEINAVVDLILAVKNISPRNTVPRSRVKEGIKRADVLAEQMVETGVNAVITKWAADHGMQLSQALSEIENKTGTPWQDSLTSEFPEFVEALDISEVEYFIIGGSTSENQVLVLNNRRDRDLTAVSEAYSKSLPGEKGRDRRKQRLPIVVVSQLSPGKNPQIPREVVEVIQETEGWSFFSAVLGLLPKTKRVKTNLAGWTVFSLDPSLDNLEDLPAELETVSYIT
ncbi:MAG: AAA family ATPase [Actinomycetota bacterium]